MIFRTLLLLLIIPLSVKAADLSRYFNGENNDIQKIIGYKGEVPEGADLPLEQAESLGSARREESEVFNTKAILARETRLEEAGYTRDNDGFALDNKGFIDKAKQVMKDAESAFSGGYAECTPEEQIIKRETEETCEEFYDVKHRSCFARQLVEIDPKYTYQCSKKREVKDKICTDTLKNLSCKQNTECDAGGIILSSMVSNIAWDYQYPTLTINTATDHHRGLKCNKFEGLATFVVRNKNLIDEFRLINVNFDDYFRITINGIQVYNGPFGGEKLEISGKRPFAFVNTGSAGTHSCELSTPWSRAVDVDLIPYLREGSNEIKIEVIIAGRGGGWAHFRTRQHCCAEWVEEREEVCAFS